MTWVTVSIIGLSVLVPFVRPTLRILLVIAILGLVLAWPVPWWLSRSVQRSRPTPHDERSERERHLAGARELITNLLWGFLAQAHFDEGNVYTCILYVEEYQPEWLLEQLRDPAYPLANKCELLGYMHTHRREAIALLGFAGTIEEQFAQAGKLAAAAEAKRTRYRLEPER